MGTTRERIAGLGRQLESAGWDVFFAWSPTAMGYLHGYFESSHERFMALAVHRSGKAAFIGPALSGAQAERHGIADRRLWADGQDPYALLRALADEWGFASGAIALDMDMPAHMVLAMQRALPSARFEIGEPAISALRLRKGDEELGKMARAGSIADQAFVAALPQIRPGMAERDLARILEEEMRARGGSPTFCVVAAGSGSAEPHHLSDATQLQAGHIVVMDFGCDFERYQSDITRTVCLGQPSQEMSDVYGIVYEAHRAARAAIAPGVPAQEIDRAARKVIEKAGYGEQFFHRVGHGIGMQVHESPYIVEGNAEPLQVGNCFSVEPGIYLAGRFGVRIENIVAVTESGHRSFNEEPSPELIALEA